MGSTIEGIHLKFLKHCCGVNKKCSNWGILSETGRKQTVLFVFQQMIKFWWHVNDSKSHIVKNALKASSRELSDNGHKSWFSAITTKVYRWLGYDFLLNNDYQLTTKNLKAEINRKFEQIRSLHRKAVLNSPDSKLHLFAHLMSPFQNQFILIS